MPQKTGLGRGLGALIPGGDNTQMGNGVILVPVQKVLPNPRQPRNMLHPESLEELTLSVREHGVLQPLIVTLGESDGLYILIAGERRLEAARLAGLATVPVLVREATDQQRLELAIIENVQRSDLSALEEAEAYRQLAEDFELSHEAIAARVGKSRVAVTNTLRLLRLPDSVKNALIEKRISEGHARALLALSTPEAQTAALHTVLGQELNVRQTEELVTETIRRFTSTQAKTHHSPRYSGPGGTTTLKSWNKGYASVREERRDTDNSLLFERGIGYLDSASFKGMISETSANLLR